VYNEISREAHELGIKDTQWISGLTASRFNSEVYNQAYSFLESLKQLYVNRYNNADKRKEEKIRLMTNTPEREMEYIRYKEHYHNETITDFVKNLSETHRIIEKDGKLIQKIYPIYKDPDPDHVIDFDAQFYMPSKHFLNQNIDTFFFNTGVIWSMTLVLGILLYLDVLRRIIDGIGNLSTPAALKRK
jgi:hypothetical protein